MSDFAFIDIIFFAMVAAFIAFRLRSVLGRRTGHERRRPDRFSPPEPSSTENVVTLPGRNESRKSDDFGLADIKDAELKKGLTAIRLADHRFDIDGFLEGARAAFTMIIEAFAAGDKATLEPLLADPVYQSFAAAIDQREAAVHELATEIVAIRSAEIAEAGMSGSTASVTVRFVTDQINVTRDAAGNIVDGDPGRTDEVVDLWTFARNTHSSDPNWQLVLTRAPE